MNNTNIAKSFLKKTFNFFVSKWVLYINNKINQYIFFILLQSVIRNEIFYTSYSYPFFHLSMALGLMFITTQLTRWFAPIVSTIYSQHLWYLYMHIVYFSGISNHRFWQILGHSGTQISMFVGVRIYLPIFPTHAW